VVTDKTSEQRDKGSDITRFLSLRTISRRVDADASSVRRWLAEAGVPAVVMGKGRHAAIRFRLEDVETWLKSRERIQ
jgi:hypothetical protein